jgi:hypothetical protein
MDGYIGVRRNCSLNYVFVEMLACISKIANASFDIIPQNP